MSIIDDKVRYAEQVRPLYKLFVEKLENTLRNLIEVGEIPYAQVERRVKKIDSFFRKASEKEYKDPFADTKDIGGLRIVTYYDTDVDRVGDIIQKEFEVDWPNSSDKLDRLAPTEFGYRSVHYVVSLKPPRSAHPIWSDYSELVAEIQVRSVLQHAWAAISHKLDYKEAKQAPPEVRRRLFRLSALLEIADDEFISIRKCIQEIKTESHKQLQRDKKGETLDYGTMIKFIVEEFDRQEWKRRAIGAGFPEMAEWIPSGSDHGRVIALVAAAEEAGCVTVDDFRELVPTLEERADQILNMVANDICARGCSTPDADGIEALATVLVFELYERIELHTKSFIHALPSELLRAVTNLKESSIAIGEHEK